MSITSLPPNAPTTNGTLPAGHGEADVSSHPGCNSSSLQNVCALLSAQVNAFLSAPPKDDVTKRTQEQTKITLRVIDKALQDYEFGAVSLSYNGGKDCLVLLILYLAVLHTHFTHPKNRRKDDAHLPFPKTIPSIYAKPPDPFPAVSSFVDYSSKLYHLDLTHISTNPGPRRKEKSHSNPPPTDPLPQLKAVERRDSEVKPLVSFRDAFALYLSAHPEVQAIFVGTRRTDPHGGHLTHFDPTDHNWPKFMRIHPVIDWNLSEIWCFLRSPHLKDLNTEGPLKYCTMYDDGYTSLGGVNDTVKNPKLRYKDENGNECFHPAFKMTQDDGERLGRE